MKKHPEYGADILGTGVFYDVAREVALHHHERWDGSGYPFGLKGEAIPLAARIVMVCRHLRRPDQRPPVQAGVAHANGARRTAEQCAA